MKKIILTVFAATSLLLYSTPSFAISLSVGVPIAASFTAEKDNGDAYKADGSSGYFLGVQLPFGLGLGMDSHSTKIKDDSDKYKIAHTMYNLYYQLPVPVVSLILGLGTGNSNYDCPDAGFGGANKGKSCADMWDKGSATQWYTSVGFPIIPFFDIHLSYRSITSKNVKAKGGDTKQDLGGTITGVGIAFNF
jgi:hypothetical protein